MLRSILLCLCLTSTLVSAQQLADARSKAVYAISIINLKALFKIGPRLNSQCLSGLTDFFKGISNPLIGSCFDSYSYIRSIDGLRRSNPHVLARRYPLTSHERVRGILYYPLRSFYSREASSAITQIRRAPMSSGRRYVVFDLRNNNGGPIVKAYELASAFVLDDSILIHRWSVNNQERIVTPRSLEKVGTKLSVGKFVGDCVAFVVNLGTASAAEIVVGAAQSFAHHQDRVCYRVFGSGTAGKRLGQSVVPLGDKKHELVLTTFSFTIGEPIPGHDRSFITPDEVVAVHKDPLPAAYAWLHEQMK